MKMSRLVRLVLVAFVPVGLVAPQQAEASEIDMDGTCRVTRTGEETTFTPESIALAGLEGLRREIATRQNRYA
jgi:hypothetical protein